MRRQTLQVTIASVLGCVILALAPMPASAQSGSDTCVERGHKPGSAGFYRCLQGLQTGGTSGLGALQNPRKSEAEKVLESAPDNAIGEFTGGAIEGASNPDPDLLKQLEPSDLTPTAPGEVRR